MVSKRSTSLQSQAARNRQRFVSLDADGQEAWTRLIDQEIHTLGEAARRDEEAFLALVQSLLRAGHEVDATVRALAGLDSEKGSSEILVDICKRRIYVRATTSL